MNEHETPLPTAPIWRRFAAIFYDSVVVLALWMVVGFAVLWVFGIDGNVNADEEGMPYLSTLYSYTLFISMILSAWLFFAWFWTHSGQTIGMQAWKIKIQNRDGTAISYRQTVIRCLLGAFSLLLVGLGHWVALLNSDRESIPDRLSKSVVVKVPR